MLKIAMLSSWHVHAGGYAQQINRRKDATVTAVWDENPENGKKFAAELSVDFEPDLDKLLARTDVDAVCVNAPTNMHREVMVKAANAGKHIFTEKVLALSIEDCEAIKSAVEKNNVKFCISFPHRTFPHNLLAKKVVEDKILGRITLFRVRNAHNGASANWLPSHFYDETQCGGGAMIDLGAHPMYLIRWLMGKPAEMSSAFTKVTDHAVEDNAVSVMKYADGAIAISETGFVSGASPFMLEMYGTDGTFIVNGNKVSLCSPKVTTAGFGGFVTPNELPQSLPDPISQFVDGVLYDKEIIFGMQDAIELTEMMVAAYKSHKQNAFVAV
ncbi:MAG: Gfo/Idh/MocA family oxidoreductase [Defluviitaleaceae bacterium]|nr:Gfo/Idh/MocA family oxidoreductase [Defluviitaleaceae bacterium]